jgi:hypothetical protein
MWTDIDILWQTGSALVAKAPCLNEKWQPVL